MFGNLDRRLSLGCKPNSGEYFDFVFAASSARSILFSNVWFNIWHRVGSTLS
jgi:hypothetical protein